MVSMVFHMKTTLNIDDTVMAALRQHLQRSRTAPTLPPLPSFDSGGAQVDVADRDALYRAM